MERGFIDADDADVCNLLDFAAVDAVVDATHRHKGIFYADD